MLSRYQVVGELSLDGRVKAVAGVLPMAVGAQASGAEGMVVPLENAAEAAVVDGVPVFGVETLGQAVGFFQRHGRPGPARSATCTPCSRQEAA